MHPELAAVAATQNGVFLRRQAVAVGYTDDEIARLVRRRMWHRLRRGAYCEAALLADDRFGDIEMFLRTQASALVLEEPAYASHTSAAAVHGLPRWGTTDQCHFHPTTPSRRSARGGHRAPRGRAAPGPDHHAQRHRRDRPGAYGARRQP